MTISRRTFLQMSSAALLSVSYAPQLRFLGPFASGEATYGRAFGLTEVRSAGGSVIRRLWSNEVVRLLDVDGERYRIDDGYVRREDVQPMMPYPPATEFPFFPVRAEVAAPQAVIREFCSADAPILAAIGHGGVARVIDKMTDGRGGGDWLAVELDSGSRYGWSQAVHWREAAAYPPRPNLLPHKEGGGENAASRGWTRLELDQRDFTLTAFYGEETLLTAPFATGESLHPGRYRVLGSECAGVCGRYQGAPWPISVDALGEIVGAYWHNRFGGVVEGAGIEVAPAVAKWLAWAFSGSGEVVVLPPRAEAHG